MGSADPQQVPQPSSAPEGIPVPPAVAAIRDYEFLREINRGGMGVVYLVRNRRMDRLEGLKVIQESLLRDAKSVERFEREIRSAARLNHPNIVTAYSCPFLEGGLAFAMEFVEGIDLCSLVQSHGPLPVSNACYYAYQVALGLQHAHERQMVHRDIKPNNLMLTCDADRQTVKILDFGLAKATSEGPAEGGLTGTTQMMGTPHYIAPEQVLNAAKADIRADIYGLGCTLYHLLSGGPPFQHENLYEILHAHRTEVARPLNQVRPEVPPELTAIVAKMMAKDLTERFQKPAEVAQALAPYFQEGLHPMPAADPSRRPVAATDSAVGQAMDTDVVEPASGTDNLVAPSVDAQKASTPRPIPSTPPIVVSSGSRRDLPRRKGWRDPSSNKGPTSPKYWPAITGCLIVAGLLAGWAGGLFHFGGGTDRNAGEGAAIDGREGDSQRVPEPVASVGDGKSDMAGKMPADSQGSPASVGREQAASGTGAVDSASTSGSSIPSPDLLKTSRIPAPSTENQPAVVEIEVDPPPLPESEPDPEPSPKKPIPLVAEGQVAGEMRDDNGLKLQLMWCPPGRFTMGSPKSETGRGADEDQVTVTLTRGFWLGKFELTQDQWQQVMRTAPWKGPAENVAAAGFPATNLSWDDVNEFVKRLTEQERAAGRLPDGWEYTQPTEAQWEYACRSGGQTTTRFSFGDDEAGLSDHGWWGGLLGDGNAKQEQFVHHVGLKKPNPWGLHDMHGNVWEWCRDRYSHTLPGGADPEVTSGGTRRVNRGGGWVSLASSCRSACRKWDAAVHRDYSVGFRVALSRAD